MSGGLVVLLSFGGFFEFYDLFFTPYVMPGLIRSQIFREGQNGLFGLPDQASFLSCTFAGLFLGTIVFASVADKFGRRVIFTYALLWYALATGIMAAQDSRGGILLWRFIAGVGIGVELVTIDTYISELVLLRGDSQPSFCHQSGDPIRRCPACHLSVLEAGPNRSPGDRWLALGGRCSGAGRPLRLVDQTRSARIAPLARPARPAR